MAISNASPQTLGLRLELRMTMTMKKAGEGFWRVLLNRYEKCWAYTGQTKVALLETQTHVNPLTPLNSTIGRPGARWAVMFHTDKFKTV